MGQFWGGLSAIHTEKDPSVLHLSAKVEHLEKPKHKTHPPWGGVRLACACGSCEALAGVLSSITTLPVLLAGTLRCELVERAGQCTVHILLVPRVAQCDLGQILSLLRFIS